MGKFNTVMEEKIIPATTRLSDNKILKSMTAGMMGTLPLSLGVSLIMIVTNFPITAWTTWLAETGIAANATAIVQATTSIIAIYISFLIAYNNAKLNNADGLTSGVLSLAGFLILMPHQITTEEGVSVAGLSFDYLGSKGVFIGILISIVISSLYIFLKQKNLSIKLPNSVPEMVAKSLSPTFISIIIFVLVFLVRVGFTFTSYGNIFDAFNTIIGTPILSFGATPLALIVVFTLVNLFWCFGIHPSVLSSFYLPVLYTVITGNITAFTEGQPLPYLAMFVAYQLIMLGGTGCTLGLVFNMVLFGKSEKYKALGKLAIVPNIFNINEPVIFGAPIVYNPIYVVPMVLIPVVNGSIAVLATSLGWFNTYNPTIRVPWTMPAPIIHFLQSGWLPALLVIGIIILDALIYLPFFKVADRVALKEEQTQA